MLSCRAAGKEVVLSRHSPFGAVAASKAASARANNDDDGELSPSQTMLLEAEDPTYPSPFHERGIELDDLVDMRLISRADGGGNQGGTPPAATASAEDVSDAVAETAGAVADWLEAVEKKRLELAAAKAEADAERARRKAASGTVQAKGRRKKKTRRGKRSKKGKGPNKKAK